MLKPHITTRHSARTKTLWRTAVCLLILVTHDAHEWLFCDNVAVLEMEGSYAPS